MSDTKPTGEISGKITAAPNPVPFGQTCVVSWETTDRRGAQVRVFTPEGYEKLVSEARSGQTEVPWIVDSAVYEFRLYPLSQPNNPIDSVQVRRDIASAPAVLRDLADEALRGSISPSDLSSFLSQVLPLLLRGSINPSELSSFVSQVIPLLLQNPRFREFFMEWERQGFHVTPVHFYQPLPEIRALPETLWTQSSELVGVDMNDAAQLELLRHQFPRFRQEYERFPTQPVGNETRFYLTNGLFDGTDALVAYCMIRHFQPRVIIEVGSGFSSLLVREANANGNPSKLLCIEPFPRDFLQHDFPGADALVQKNVQDVDLAFFSQLEAGDILFIDSSHTVKIGGDVNYLFLEVVPRLKPGVIVHVHDISFPFDYRRKWVMDELRFWNEQYLLQAFLAFNSDFEVLMANNYLAHHHLDELQAVFPKSPWWGGGSFWMRRRLS